MEIEAAEAFLLERREEPVGRLRVSAPVVFAHRVIARILPAFCQKYPSLEVEIHATDGLSDLIEDGFDVLIRTRALPDSALIARKIIDTRFVTAASPEYLKRAGRPETPDDLKNHVCTAYVFPS
ncbi:MAG: substrate binding domain-containing protein, partial [Pseudomonadota bacterium]